MYQITTTAAATQTIIYLLLFVFRIRVYYIGENDLLKSTFGLIKLQHIVKQI